MLIKSVDLTRREVATILAALRYWQSNFNEKQLADIYADHFQSEEPLDPEEIDNLCEIINMS